MTMQLVLVALVVTGLPVEDGSVLAAQGYELVRVEPGEFLMGSPEGEAGRNSDEAQHAVSITSAFEIGVTEVTIQLYKAVVDDPFRETSVRRYPVESVTWFEAVSFCILLSLREGLTPAYQIEGRKVLWVEQANGYRLPTESEWEYAARAGETTMYAGSDRLEEVTAFEMGKREVGEDKANAWGLHDMTGNVAEWCWDGYADYPRERSDDPVSPPEGAYRIVRGGSYTSGPMGRLRVACRERGDAGIRSKDRGFRIVRSLTP